MTKEELERSLNIEENIIPLGRQNRPRVPLTPTHITIHNTDNANRGADARAHGRFVINTGYYILNGKKQWVSWHYTVDDKRVVQHLPVNEVAYHAKKGNAVSIGIEICMNEGIDQEKAFRSAAQLSALLILTIPSLQKDLTKIVPHKFWTGKNCPSLLLGRWSSFIQMVKEVFNSIAVNEVASLESISEVAEEKELYEINPVVETSRFHSDEDDFDGRDYLGNIEVTQELIATGERVHLEGIPKSNLESLQSENGWDNAHNAKETNPAVEFEPNVDNIYVFKDTTSPDFTEDNFLESTVDRCKINNDFEAEWPFPKDATGTSSKSIWHLAEEFSQLLPARNSVANNNNIVRIAHLDTGYDPDHAVFPDTLVRHKLERNFVEDENQFSAVDNFSTGILKNPGHGTGTLSILAGKTIDLAEYNFNSSIGIEKGIEIIPIRVAKSVVLFKSANFVKAVKYVISLYDNHDTRCHIITMSMGGLASKAWADVVNEAYEKGIFIVTAAGNNFAGLPTRTLIYPARFNRVVAACGVTFDYTPYFRKNADLNIMQGNFGPRKAMRTAVAAFTPNMPWAKINCNNIVSLAGAGTSSATPQIAAAAALYYKKYFTELEEMDEGWKRVETIRQALFSTAKKTIKDHDNDVELYFGAGVLQAAKMLEVSPRQINITKKMKETKDKISFPLLTLLVGFGLEETLESMQSVQKQEMLETEIVQLIQQSKELQELLNEEEELDEEQNEAFRNQILSMAKASNTLKAYLDKNRLR